MCINFRFRNNLTKSVKKSWIQTNLYFTRNWCCSSKTNATRTRRVCTLVNWLLLAVVIFSWHTLIDVLFFIRQNWYHSCPRFCSRKSDLRMSSIFCFQHVGKCYKCAFICVIASALCAHAWLYMCSLMTRNRNWIRVLQFYVRDIVSFLQ